MSRRFWQKKYPGVDWNYWFSANGNWSYYYRVWAIQARKITTSRKLSEQNRDLREAHIKSLYEMEELKRVQELRVDESSRRRLIENQDTINELTAKIQELQKEVNCMNDSKYFKDAESVRSGLSHVPSQPAFLPPYRDLGGMQSRPGGMLSRNDKPQDIWDTHGISGKVSVNPPASSSSPYPGVFNPWISNVTEDTSPHVSSERQKPDTTLDPRCQSGPSARNSFDPMEGRFSRGRPTTTADFRSSLWQIPYTNNICLLEDKIQNWGMYLFTMSYGSYAVDQRSGYGCIGGWSEIFAFH